MIITSLESSFIRTVGAKSFPLERNSLIVPLWNCVDLHVYMNGTLGDNMHHL
ncbi:hypothetical protein JOB18_049456 [Solea senegalensis]|uniref:Uncharacterized protein n=1 Tax=Solea senegalensis TaxID=28829 RepID=A0AAV6PC69_SOLSE|nr:hypothetical protein JOB18_049456 [Solea senegalensis]